MKIKKRIINKLRDFAKKLRIMLFPTATEQKRKLQQEAERTDRYEKYIPNYMKQVYTTIVLWGVLACFGYFMMFGISKNIENDLVRIESRKKYKEVLKSTRNFDDADNAAAEYIKQHPVKVDSQIDTAWNYVMKPLNLDNDVYINILILIAGAAVGLKPIITLEHRKKIVDKMHAEKWKFINPIDKTDDKIIHDMSKDTPNYFYHLTLSLTGPDKLQKYKKIAIPIVQGYAKSHPEDNKRTMAILKAFGKTK